ncbi:MAG: hypothetical protein KC561_03245, partial [Myxococcales bacterium]|nr:hypothetical protein [Myxococcales bacterium]
MWTVPLTIDSEFAPKTHIGGKAVGLRTLIEAGFRVPEGYVVTTQAYRRSLQNGLLGLKTPEKISHAVEHIVIPVEVKRAIVDTHEAFFNGSPVAVRSSATGEDGERRSFAGQLESVLEVSGHDAVLDAIRRVWASFFRRSNLLYRGQASLDDVPDDVAVVVQRMLKPRAAGVLFTADPVSDTPDTLVISATAGLGERVVDGHSSETVYARLSTGEIVRHVPSNSGQCALQTEDIVALIGAARRVQDAFGCPQDVEWAFDEDGLALLQSRPITTVGPSRAPTPNVWSNVNVGEALPGVATPMTWSIIRSFSRRGFEQAFGALGLNVPENYELVGSFRGRVYLNLTQFASVISQVPFMSIDNVLAVGGTAESEEVEKWGYERRSKLGFLARLPVSGLRMAASQLAGPLRARTWERRFKGKVRQFERTDLSSLDRWQLRDALRELDQAFDKTGTTMLAIGSNFLSSYIVTQQLLRRWGGDEAAKKEHHLFSGLQGLVSAEPGLELLDIARSIREKPELERAFAKLTSEQLVPTLRQSVAGREVLERLDRFMDAYGHRAPREAELATPRWRETPEFLYEVIRAHLEAPYLPPRTNLEREGVRHRTEVTQIVRQHFRPGLGVLFRWVLGHTQENARLREALRSGVTHTLSLYRWFFLEVGERLTREKVVAEPEDVFFLTQPEVEAYLEGRADLQDFGRIVASRRAEYVAFSESPNPPDTFVMDASGQIPHAQANLPQDTPFLEGLA